MACAVCHASKRVSALVLGARLAALGSMGTLTSTARRARAAISSVLGIQRAPMRIPSETCHTFYIIINHLYIPICGQGGFSSTDRDMTYMPWQLLCQGLYMSATPMHDAARVNHQQQSVFAMHAGCPYCTLRAVQLWKMHTGCPYCTLNFECTQDVRTAPYR
jgi:hypothetical protein